MQNIMRQKLVNFFCRFLSKKISQDFQVIVYILNRIKHKKISQEIIHTLILAEDRRFLRHIGVDFIAISRAFWQLLIYRKLQGASTIEQQLVRTITKRYEVTVSRKIREIILAAFVSLYFTKDQIACAYLHIAYFGWRMNGIEQICSRFDIDAATASQVEAATIIARLKYPEPQYISPKQQSRIQKRINQILQLQAQRSDFSFKNPITQYTQHYDTF